MIKNSIILLLYIQVAFLKEIDKEEYTKWFEDALSNESNEIKTKFYEYNVQRCTVDDSDVHRINDDSGSPVVATFVLTGKVVNRICEVRINLQERRFVKDNNSPMDCFNVFKKEGLNSTCK